MFPLNQVIHTGLFTLMTVSLVVQERCIMEDAADLSDINDIDFERALGDLIAEMDKDDE